MQITCEHKLACSWLELDHNFFLNLEFSTLSLLEIPLQKTTAKSSWFTTGYPFQRRFLVRGMKNCGSRLYLLLKIVADYEEAFIWCISRTTKDTQVPPPGWEVMWSCAVHWFPVDSYLWKRYSQEGFRRDWSKLRYFDWPIPVFISFIEISRIYRKMK